MERNKQLEDNGWYHYYSQTHWVHKDILNHFERTNQFYYGNDHTNYQYSTDEALEINKELKLNQ